MSIAVEPEQRLIGQMNPDMIPAPMRGDAADRSTRV